MGKKKKALPLPLQQPEPVTPVFPPHPGQPEQVTQFYHFSMQSQAHEKFVRDCREMEKNDWRLVFARNVGDAGINACIVAIYQK